VGVPEHRFDLRGCGIADDVPPDAGDQFVFAHGERLIIHASTSGISCGQVVPALRASADDLAGGPNLHLIDLEVHPAEIDQFA
jgi:hypothetical protein